MTMLKCVLPRRSQGGLELFLPENDIVMLDDGHLEPGGWPRIELGKPVEPRHLLSDAAFENFDPKIGLDRFGFTGERMAGKIILFNFERTRGWDNCAKWLESVKLEIIKRVNAFDPDASPLFYLYDWTDMIETGYREAKHNIDGRMIPVNMDRPMKEWISRYRRALREYGDIPMLHPNDFTMSQCEAALAAFAHWCPNFAVWAVCDGTQTALNATRRKCDDLLQVYRLLKGVDR